MNKERQLQKNFDKISRQKPQESGVEQTSITDHIKNIIRMERLQLSDRPAGPGNNSRKKNKNNFQIGNQPKKSRFGPRSDTNGNFNSNRNGVPDNLQLMARWAVSRMDNSEVPSPSPFKAVVPVPKLHMRPGSGFRRQSSSNLIKQPGSNFSEKNSSNFAKKPTSNFTNNKQSVTLNFQNQFSNKNKTGMVWKTTPIQQTKKSKQNLQQKMVLAQQNLPQEKTGIPNGQQIQFNNGSAPQQGKKSKKKKRPHNLKQTGLLNLPTKQGPSEPKVPITNPIRIPNPNFQATNNQTSQTLTSTLYQNQPKNMNLRQQQQPVSILKRPVNKSNHQKPVSILKKPVYELDQPKPRNKKPFSYYNPTPPQFLNNLSQHLKNFEKTIYDHESTSESEESDEEDGKALVKTEVHAKGNDAKKSTLKIEVVGTGVQQSISTNTVVSLKEELAMRIPSKKKLKELNRIGWNNNKSLVRADYKVIPLPFRCCVISNFFKNPHVIPKLLEELKDLDLNDKNNDMYKFQQSTDLENISTPYIKAFREVMLRDLQPTIMKITGFRNLIKLNVSLTYSKYSYTDVLLCHNDQLDKRRFAFVLYLVDDWKDSDGGSLDLFAIDDEEKPSEIINRIYPNRNMLVFFEVTKKSFHQVAEVLSKTKSRVSINGWFYSEEIETPIKYSPKSYPFIKPGTVDEDVIYSWINPYFLDGENCAKIRKDFESNSEIALDNFLISTKYKELCDSLKKSTYKPIGPYNFRNYYVTLPQENEVLKEFNGLMSSEAMFIIISQLTGIKLHRLYEGDSDSETEDNADVDASVFIELRRWKPGCYTMLRDDDVTCRSSYALDVQLFCNVPKNWDTTYGGYVSYIAENENEELLTVLPESNRLNLIYRDKETMKFTKYINSNALDQIPFEKCYFDEIYCEYREK